MAGEDKLLALICGKTVLEHVLDAFQQCGAVDEIIVVTREDLIGRVSELCGAGSFHKVSRVMAGGGSRLESVLTGALAASKNMDLIAIHDGARPCIDAAVIERAINAAAKLHAAAPAVKISSTIKKVDNNIVVDTVDRDSLYEIQTPQVFDAGLIKAALTNAAQKQAEITDDCMAAELIGIPVHITEGSRSNIKITTPDDLIIAEAILSRGAQCAPPRKERSPVCE